MVLLVNVGLTVILTYFYYRIKLVIRKCVVNNILNNLDYAGRYLDALGIKVQTTKEQLVCTGYVTLALLIRLVNVYVLQRNMIIQERLYFLNISIPGIICTLLFNILVYFSVTVFQFHTIVLIYVLKRRIKTLCRRDIVAFFEANTAWSAGRGSVSHGRLTGMSDRRRLSNQLYIIYNCIFEAYVNIRQFYKDF